MMQGPNRAPLILGVTVVLAFGAGFVAQSVTGDTSGEAMIMTVLPILGVGRAVTGVRMMSHSSKKAPKAREVVLNTACICARSV